MSIKVKFVSEVEVKEGKKTLKAAKNANLQINDSCEGKGKCGKCIVKVLSGKLSEATKHEIKVLGKENIDKGYRLSCETNILEDSVIEIINADNIKSKDGKIEIKNNIKSKDDSDEEKKLEK